MARTRNSSLTGIGILIASAVLLAGCFGSSVYNITFHQHYSAQVLTDAHYRSPMPVVAVGPASSPDASSLTANIAATLDDAAILLPIRFAPSGSALQPRSRLVVVNSARIDLLPGTVCGSEPNPTMTDEEISNELLMVYCRDDLPMSAARIRVPDGSDLDGDAYADALHTALRQITPLRNPEHIGGCRPDCT